MSPHTNNERPAGEARRVEEYAAYRAWAAEHGKTPTVEGFVAWRDGGGLLAATASGTDQGRPFGWASTGGNYFTRSERIARRIGGLVPVYTTPRTEELNTLRAVAAEYDALIRHMDAGGDFHAFQRAAAKKEDAQ